MWGPWRLAVRKAEHALKIGRLDEAAGYVLRPEVRSYCQAREVAARVAVAFAERAEAHMRAGDSQRAWKDLDQAERLDGAHDQLLGVRQELVRGALDEAKRYVNAGQPVAAIECLDRLAKRGGDDSDVRQLYEGATAWRAAAERVRVGRTAEAIELFDKARELLPSCNLLDEARQQAWAAQNSLATLEANLHRALSSNDLTAVLSLADEILNIASDHVQARAARRRAWQAVGAPVSAVGGGRAVMDAVHFGEKTVMRRPGAPLIDEPAFAAQDDEGSEQSGQRLLLWIDGVGGYLICFGDRVSLGQPAGWHVDVPIMADLSRLHAWIVRDGEGYSLRAVRPAIVNGRSVKEQAVLKDGAEITLGRGVRMRFAQPTALSGTALLRLTSAHRLSVAVDAVLLMAETCIIGGIANAHILVPGWPRQIVLYRQAGELWCRTQGSFEVDGQGCLDRGRLTPSSRIRGDGFSLAFEPLGS